jgi:hypothetical protein
MSTPGDNQHNRFLNSLQELLESIQANPVEPQYCEHCNSPLKHVNGHFWLDSSSYVWEIPLPYCPNCNPEFLERKIQRPNLA